MDYYKVDFEKECIVIYDDVSLDIGQIRIRKKGSAGGHNGIKSIIGHMGTQNFVRIRLGIGEKPVEMDLADYVLGRFTDVERKEIDEGIKNIVKAVSVIAEQDVEKAMSLYNKSKNKEE